MIPESIWADGGVIGPNPSLLGGTWTWIWVCGSEAVRMGSGVVEPDDVGVEKITNNLTELWAVLRAVESIPKGWNGIIHTDSMVTLRRFTTSMAFNGIPHAIGARVRELRRFSKWSMKLVAGHPTGDELLKGFRKRNGLMASVWNVMCDTECTRLANEFKERLK